MIPPNHLVPGEQGAGEQDGGTSQPSNTGLNTGSDSSLDYGSAPTDPDSPDSTSETAGSKEAQRT